LSIRSIPGGQLVDKVVANSVDNMDRKPDKTDDHG
jgi:hypothetical protein